MEKILPECFPWALRVFRWEPVLSVPKNAMCPSEFKQAYLDVKEEDIVIIKSPVGMPGRAIQNNRFLKDLEVKGKTENKMSLSMSHCL